MAELTEGEVPVEIQEYCDDFCVETFGPYAAADIAADFAFKLFDRQAVIDKITVRAETDSTAEATFRFLKVKDGQTIAAAVTAGQHLNAAIDWTSGLTDATKVDITLTGNYNQFAEGDVLAIDTSATPTNLAGFTITIRYRSRIR